MPATVVRSPHEEKMWQQAKAAAKRAGRPKDWAYVMATFERMKARVGGKKGMDAYRSQMHRNKKGRLVLKRGVDTLQGAEDNPQDADPAGNSLVTEQGVVDPPTATEMPTTPGTIRVYRNGKPTKEGIRPDAYPKPMVYSKRAVLAKGQGFGGAESDDRVLDAVDAYRWLLKQGNHPNIAIRQLRDGFKDRNGNFGQYKWLQDYLPTTKTARDADRADAFLMQCIMQRLPIPDVDIAGHNARKRAQLSAEAHVHTGKKLAGKPLRIQDSGQGVPHDGPRIHKSASPESDGHWVTMHGTHVWIDEKGQPQWPGSHTKPNRPYTPGDPLPAHMGSLKIPPAWQDVQVNTDPEAALWVTGRDKEGRRQTVYAPAFLATNAAAKFQRIQALDAERAALQGQIAKAQKSHDPAIRQAADCLALIAATGIRPGSDRETHAKVKAYGATTLEGRHVTREADGTVVLDYVGKKGVALRIPLTDPAIARMVWHRAQAAGPNGRLFGTTDAALRAFSHQLDHGRFKPKDFRTATGTRFAQELIQQQKPPTDPKSYAQAVRRVAQAVAKKLGNTPTVALNSYIAPQVFADWRSAAGV